MNRASTDQLLDNLHYLKGRPLEATIEYLLSINGVSYRPKSGEGK